MLPWLDRNRMWALPFCHAVFFGLVKNFCDLLFPLAGAKKPKVYEQQARLHRAMMALPSRKKLSKAARDRVYERVRKLVSDRHVGFGTCLQKRLLGQLHVFTWVEISCHQGHLQNVSSCTEQRLESSLQSTRSAQDCYVNAAWGLCFARAHLTVESSIGCNQCI